MFYGNKLIIQYNKVICERNVFMCRLKVSHFAYLESRKIYNLIYPLHGKKHV